MKTFEEKEREIMKDSKKRERLEEYVKNYSITRHMSEQTVRQQALYKEYIKYLYDLPEKIVRE